MRDFSAILKELKLHLSKDGESTKVYDKEVAEALGISPINLATLKKRNSIPFERILNFCYQEELCCSEIFFD